MADMMTFPDTVEEFMEQYKITDTKQIYTNGAELVPIFRMRQWFDHKPERKTGHWIRHPEQKNIYGGKCIECSECGEKYMVQYIEDEKFCRNCGTDMRGEES